MTAPHGLFGGNPRDSFGFLDAMTSTAITTFYRANLPRFGLYDSASDTGSPGSTSQSMTAVPIKLAGGDVITNITIVTGATAGATISNWWFALYDSSATPALLAQTADQTSGAIAANTVITKALATVQTISKSGIYWVAMMFNATTQPSLLGAVTAPPIITGERNLSVTSGSSLTATATGTLASPAARKFSPLVVLT